MNNKWLSTKFAAAGYIIVASSIMVFMKLIDGGTWVAVATLALGVYAAGNVAAQKVGSKDPGP